jgi:hypothetical protein
MPPRAFVAHDRAISAARMYVQMAVAAPQRHSMPCCACTLTSSNPP